MCGVAGFVNLDSRLAAREQITSMTNSLRHRGPDGEGQWVEKNVALGHRRLAIIDLSPEASQPMFSDDSRYVISYNGELYNYRELKVNLEALGYKFFSSSDTEVVLKSYIEWGEQAVDKFNGMFSFAIYDRQDELFFLARDRYGIKPLYVFENANVFSFASENKAFFESGIVEKKICSDQLAEYLSFQNFLTDKCLFEGVSLFPAGHYGYYNIAAKRLIKTCYWDYQFSTSADSEYRNMTEQDYIEELDRLLQQAVSRQLVGDVEIGSFLSGGMDSGSLTALAAKQIPFIKTFTVGFDMNSASGLELSFDERAKAEHMSYLFKTEHYEMVLKSGDMERCMEKLVYHLEEPRVGQSYPNYYAAKLAGKFNKVVLSGVGGDEIFAGYPWRYYRAIGHKNFDSYIDGYFDYWQRMLKEDDLKRIIFSSSANIDGLKSRFRDVYMNHENVLSTPEDYINHSLYFEAKTFLQGLLVVEDKLSMAHSLESRVPFLDNDLVDFAMKIPTKFKLKNLKEAVAMNENDIGSKTRKYFEKTNDGKLILRKVMKRHIPDTVVNRVKQGFSAPDASWFKGESIDYVKDRLFNNNARIYDFLDRKEIRKFVELHVSGKENHRLLVWSFLYLEEMMRQG